MKVLLFISIFILSQNIYSQDSITNTNNTPTYYSPYNWRSYIGPIKSPTFGIFTRLDGVSDKALLSTTGIEWTVGNHLFYHGQLRFAYRITGTPALPSSVQNLFSQNRVGLLHGIGGYLFDFRKNDLGWSMIMSGAVGLEVNIPNIPTQPFPIANLFVIVSEINTIARYHFTKKHAFQFGINIGLDFSLNQQQAIASSVSLDTSFRYGLRAGFSF